MIRADQGGPRQLADENPISLENMTTNVHLEYFRSDAVYRREHLVFPIEIDGLRFSMNQADRADWLVVASFVNRSVTTFVPRQRRILLVTEPNGYFPQEYVNQYGILVSPFNVSGFDGVWFHSHGALVSSFAAAAAGSLGRLDYRALATLAVPEKRDVLTAVVSRKTILPGHRQRLRFLRTLRAALGDKLQVYGRGFRPVADKADVILPNKYHLVLENTVMPAYWTEKLADAYLGYAFPFVSGPPDLARWFPPESFLAIDIRQPEAAIDTIRSAIANDIYAARQSAVAGARERLLRNERVCPLIARVIAANPSNEPRLAQAHTIGAPPRVPFLQRVTREAQRLYWQVDERVRENLIERR